MKRAFLFIALLSLSIPTFAGALPEDCDNKARHSAKIAPQKAAAAKKAPVSHKKPQVQAHTAQASFEVIDDLVDFEEIAESAPIHIHHHHYHDDADEGYFPPHAIRHAAPRMQPQPIQPSLVVALPRPVTRVHQCRSCPTERHHHKQMKRPHKQAHRPHHPAPVRVVTAPAVQVLPAPLLPVAVQLHFGF